MYDNFNFNLKKYLTTYLFYFFYILMPIFFCLIVIDFDDQFILSTALNFTKMYQCP